MTEFDEQVAAKVLKQVEFYFSDSNLPKDKFLKQQVDSHPEGYVDLSLIVSFTRMRDLLKLGSARPEDISDDVVTAVADMLRQSKALTVSESGFQVKRATPLPSAKEAARAVDSRSLYVRPFPMTASLDDIQDLFREHGVEFNAVRVRRHLRSKDFKGSIFLECISPEESDRVMHLHLQYEGAPLRFQKKQAYLAQKIAERKAKSAATGQQEQLTLAILEEMDSDCEIPALTEINRTIDLAAAAAAVQQQQQQSGGGQKRKEPDHQADEGAAAAAAEEGDVADGEPAAALAEPAMEQYDPGCILLLTLQHQPDDSDGFTLINLIKETFGKEKIRFVEQQQQQQHVEDAGPEQQQKQGGQQQQQAADDVAPAAAAAASGGNGGSRHAVMVRFRQAADAKAALELAAAAGADFKVAGCDATVQLVEGQQEHEYYKRAAMKRAAAAKRGDNDHHRGGRGGGRGRGGRGARGGRRGGGGKRGRH